MTAMTKRACILGTLTLALALTAARGEPTYERLVTSAQSFQQYFQDLKGAGTSLNPFERVVFSLVLSNTRSAEPVDTCAPTPGN